MKRLEPKGKQIADYVLLYRTQRSWHIWAGNPFCIGLHIIPLKKMTEIEIIKLAKKNNDSERKRFVKNFPDIKWEVMSKN